MLARSAELAGLKKHLYLKLAQESGEEEIPKYLDFLKMIHEIFTDISQLLPGEGNFPQWLNERLKGYN